MANKTSRIFSRAIFKFKPFSPKQKKVLTWWCDTSPVKDSEGIIADGAIRSGKTVSMSLSFVLWAMYRFDGQNFGMCGKTIGSFRRNVVFWLKIMLRTRGYKVHDHRIDNLLVITKNSITNYFYIFGGKDERSQDLIQGITLAGVFFDEVVLMPESFVKQAIGRCSVDGSKYWFNCNPGPPFHWFYLEWILKAKKKKILYLHFLMDDNWSLSEATKERYRSNFTGLFFKRFILGLWVLAIGAIYDMWTDDNLCDDSEIPTAKYQRYITIDYGTVNPMVFLDVRDDGEVLWIVNEYYYDSRTERKQKTDSQYADDLEEFIGDEPAELILDPSAASFKTELNLRGYEVLDADNEVLDGIRMVSSMIGKRLIRASRRCANFQKELTGYVWDEKAAKLGVEKPLKQSDHAMDAIRYLVKTIVTPFVGESYKSYKSEVNISPF